MVVHPSDISFVIQGPFFDHSKKKSTQQTAQTIRKFFPGALIIFSTWSEPPCPRFWDLLVLNEDPGPGKSYYLDARTVPDNINRQLVSTRGGVINASTRYAVKLRSDLFFTSSALLAYISKLSPTSQPYAFTKYQLITASNLTCNPMISNTMLYHPCDWIVAGYTSDLISYYSIPMAKEDHFNYHHLNHIPADYQHPIASRYADEQYILIENLKKHNVPVEMIADAYQRSCLNLKESVKVFSANYKFIPSWKLGFNCYKYKISYLTSIPHHLTLKEADNLLEDATNYNSKSYPPLSYHRTITNLKDSIKALRA